MSRGCILQHLGWISCLLVLFGQCEIDEGIFPPRNILSSKSPASKLNCSPARVKMANLLSKVAIVGIVLIGILYQLIFKTIIFDIMGYGRVITSIKAFPHFRCEKVDELGLEACEEFWLHNATGYLYMACSDSQSRTQWFPPFVHQPLSEEHLLISTASITTMPQVEG